MTLDEMEEAFERASEREYTGIFACDGRFGTRRSDLHAFLLLESILPKTPEAGGYVMDFVAAAEHDQIWLDVDVEALAEVITEEQIQELDSCGVMFESEGLSMFV